MKSRTLLGIASIGIAAVICFVVAPLFTAVQSQKATIIRVKKEIRAGESITKEALETVKVGSYNMPPSVIKNEADAVGKYAKADILPGDYVLKEKLSKTEATENTYLYGLDGTRHALSISVTFTSGLSGKLKSGDIVSVIVPDYLNEGTAEILPELKYVEVIAVTANTGNDTDNGSDNKTTEEKELPSSVTLLVNEEQSRLQSAKKRGRKNCEFESGGCNSILVSNESRRVV